MAIAALSGWTSEQKHVVAASFLGWSLDACERAIFVQPKLCILCTNRMLTGAAESVWRSKLCKR
jgi:hypothetical protein